LEPLALDGRRALTTIGVVDRRAVVAVRLASLPRGEELDLAGVGWQGWTACERVREGELQTVARIALHLLLSQRDERGLGLTPRVAMWRRRDPIPLDPRRLCIPDQPIRVPGRPLDRLLGLRERLVHALADAHQAGVHPVEPDAGLVAPIVVVVPAPVGRGDQIAGLHGERLSV